MRLTGVTPSRWGKLIQLRIAGFSMQYTTADLVQFNGFEQCLEIALAKPFIALALNNLEEHRAYDGVGEDLQQYAVLGGEPSMRICRSLREARSS